MREMIDNDFCDSIPSTVIESCRPILYRYWNEEQMNPMELHLIANLFLVILEKSEEEDQIDLVSTVLEKMRPESGQFLVDFP